MDWEALTDALGNAQSLLDSVTWILQDRHTEVVLLEIVEDIRRELDIIGTMI